MSPDEKRLGAGKPGLLDDVRRAFERDGFGGIWTWAVRGGDQTQDGLALRARRFNAAAHFAGNRKDQAATQADEKRWSGAQVEYRKERDRLEARIERRRHPDLPSRVAFFELLHHAPGPHIHVAAPYAQLVQICKVAESMGLRVGEFPPFDPVECVHVTGSFHYRDKDAPGVAESCAAVQNGDSSGLAADLNHLTDAAAEYRFYLDLRAIAA